MKSIVYIWNTSAYTDKQMKGWEVSFTGLREITSRGG